MQDEIRKIEDPTGFYNVKNSVTIAAKPIPPSKPDANPIYVTGVAIFPDVVEKVPDLTKFSIFVTGLSNGWAEDPQTHLVKRKTLQAELPPVRGCPGAVVRRDPVPAAGRMDLPRHDRKSCRRSRRPP